MPLEPPQQVYDEVKE